MMKPFEVGFSYFCAHCEDEVVGIPAGSRILSGRPLCPRCAEIGDREGWGVSSVVHPNPVSYGETPRRGIALILFLLLVSGLLLFAAMVVDAPRGRR